MPERLAVVKGYAQNLHNLKKGKIQIKANRN
jgi:hypothetical protein